MKCVYLKISQNLEQCRHIAHTVENVYKSHYIMIDNCLTTFLQLVQSEQVVSVVSNHHHSANHRDASF